MPARPPTHRRRAARTYREQAAELAFLRPHPPQVANGEEQEYVGPGGRPSYVANYSKALPHNRFGEVEPAAYRSLRRALASGDPERFEQIRLGLPATGVNLTNPQAGLAFDLEGPDARSLAMPPAPRIDGPEAAAEMAELYWMALLRDVSFTDYGTGDDTDAGPDSTSEAAASLTEELSAFSGPREPSGEVSPATLFRGFTRGDLVGPYVSQFLLRGSHDPAVDLGHRDGYISYGTLVVDQRSKTAQPGIDHMTDFADWLAVQRGADRRGSDSFDPERRFIRNLRDLATWVHFDALYEAYLNACLLLLALPARLDPGNPYVDSRTQDGFGTFGGPHILSLVTEVATRALKAVWYQKWFVHRRLRPEALGGRIEVHRNRAAGRYPMVHPEILEGAVGDRVEARFGSALLPQAFAEGSPTHPAYGAGHATVAGACVTILKAWFDESQVIPDPVVSNPAGTGLDFYAAPPGEPPLTVGGELDKVASNVALARNAAGVHWRSDYTESVLLGERIAIGILEEQASSYNEEHELSLTRFDGTVVAIGGPR